MQSINKAMPAASSYFMDVDVWPCSVDSEKTFAGAKTERRMFYLYSEITTRLLPPGRAVEVHSFTL